VLRLLTSGVAKCGRRYVNIVKGNVGPGCLSMPYTFAEGGLVPSLLILLVFAPACIYCMNLLVYSKHRILASNAAAGVSPSKLNFEEVRDVKAPAFPAPLTAYGFMMA